MPGTLRWLLLFLLRADASPFSCRRAARAMTASAISMMPGTATTYLAARRYAKPAARRRRHALRPRDATGADFDDTFRRRRRPSGADKREPWRRAIFARMPR